MHLFLPPRCVKKGADGEVSAAEASLCDQDEVPPRAQVCFLACPNECAASAWGPWSSCPLVRHNHPSLTSSTVNTFDPSAHYFLTICKVVTTNRNVSPWRPRGKKRFA